jgi:aspartyl-tRNA(Asn)/glutamyl-tRNA(Gln) amidotransferase subunit B
MPIIIDDEWLEEIKANKPVAVDEKAEEYREAGISEKEIEMLISNHKVAKLLDDTVALGCNPKDTAAWILTDCAGVLRKDGKTLNDLTMSAQTLSSIIKMVDEGKINRNAGKKVLIAVVEDGVDPVAYCKEQGLDRKVDSSAIESVIDKVIENNAQAVEDFKNGKVKAMQALFGACMKELRGAGDPAMIKELLENKLK